MRIIELFNQDFVVSQVKIAIFVPPGNAKRLHSNRLSHGFAFSVNCNTTYRFDTGMTLTCCPGQCIYLPKGSNYTVDSVIDSPNSGTAHGVGTYAINFQLLDDKGPYSPFLIHTRGKDQVLSCFAKAESAWRQKSIGFYEECFSSLYQLTKIFKKEQARYSYLDGVLTKIAPALRYIESNYTTEVISLPHIAQLCGMSEPHLRKLFNAAFSVSPSIYIRNIRLNYAKELLRTGEYSVTAVALMSGFNNVSYFTREFKKNTGVSPREYNLPLLSSSISVSNKSNVSPGY